MTHPPSLKLIIKHLDYKIPCNLETNIETPLETNLETPLFETIIEIPPEISTETFQETTPEIDIKEFLPQYDILGFTLDQLSDYTKAMQNLVNNYNLHRCGSTLDTLGNNILAQFNNEIDLIIK